MQKAIIVGMYVALWSLGCAHMSPTPECRAHVDACLEKCVRDDVVLDRELDVGSQCERNCYNMSCRGGTDDRSGSGLEDVPMDPLILQ